VPAATISSPRTSWSTTLGATAPLKRSTNTSSWAGRRTPGTPQRSVLHDRDGDPPAEYKHGSASARDSVSRKMWMAIWPPARDRDSPFTSIIQWLSTQQLAGAGDDANTLRPVPRRAMGEKADRSQRLEAVERTFPTPNVRQANVSATRVLWRARLRSRRITDRRGR